MTATLIEAITERRRRAGVNAVRAASALANGLANDIGAQMDLETALTDFRTYNDLYDDLLPVVGDLGPYRRGGFSLVADLLAAPNNDDAAGRLNAHSRASMLPDGILERRDIGIGSTFATVPTWAVDDAGPRSIAAAPLVNLLSKPMPAGAGLDVRLVRLTTAPVAAIQSALNAAIQENDPVDGFATAAVQTSALKVDLSIQLLEQGRQAVDATLLPAMVEAVDSAIGTAVLAALTTLSGATQATYIDATATLAEFWAALEPLIRSVQTARKVGGHPIVVMHPRRLSWMRGRIVAENLAGFDLAGPLTPGATVSAMGCIDIVADPGVSTTSGAGTEDVVYVLPSLDAVDLFLGPPLMWVSEQGSGTSSGNLTASVIARRNLAVASRAPSSVGVLQGTGLIAPA